MGERKSLRGVAVLLVGILVLALLVLADGADTSGRESTHQLSLGLSRDGANPRHGHVDIQRILHAEQRSELRYESKQLTHGTGSQPLNKVLLLFDSLLVPGIAVAPGRVRRRSVPVRGPPAIASI